MRCEYCTRKLGQREIAHGIRYGTADVTTDVFIPDRDSSPTILCNHCAENILKLIYSKLDRTNTYQPTRTFQSN